MQGSLHDMTVADLIQHNCQDRKTAQLLIQNADQQARLFFKDGNVVHAVSDEQEGEEVVFQTLRWEEGIFNLETGVGPPAVTITRSWSGLLLEGAKRLDEKTLEEDLFETDPTIQPEVNKMAKIDDVLKEMGGEITGYIASAVVGIDGITIAHQAKAKVDAELISAQVTMLLKLVDTAVTKLGAGTVEDDLITTASSYTLMRFLPDKQYFLCVATDRKSGNLGNLRLVSKMYAERLAKAMPH